MKGFAATVLSAELQSQCLISVGVVLVAVHCQAEFGSCFGFFQRWSIRAVRSTVSHLRSLLLDDANFIQFRRMVEEARMQRFHSAIPLVVGVSALCVAYLLPVFAMAKPAERQRQTGMLGITLAMYAAMLLIKKMQIRLSPASTTVCIALLHSILFVRTIFFKDPGSWLMNSNIRVAMRMGIGMLDMDHRRTAAWNVLFLLANTQKTVQMCEGLPQIEQSWKIAVFAEFNVCILVWMFCFWMEIFTTERVRASFEVTISKTMLSHLLSVYCDAQVNLGPELQIVGSHQRLSAILRRGENIQDTSFLDHLVDADKVRFKNFIRASSQAAFENGTSTAEFLYEGPKLLPSALHVHMRDSAGRTVPAQIFHSVMTPDGELRHLLGISVDTPDPCMEMISDVIPQDDITESTKSSAPVLEALELDKQPVTNGASPDAGVAAAADAVDSASAGSTASSSENEPKELKEIILSVDPFSPELWIRSVMFNFLSPEEIQDTSLLPRISDWLSAQEFDRVAGWTSHCVNEYTYGDVSCPKLGTVTAKIGAEEIHFESLDINVCFDDYLETATECEEVDQKECSEEVESAEDAGKEQAPRMHATFRLSGFAGRRRLLRILRNVSRRHRKRVCSAGNRVPVTGPRLPIIHEGANNNVDSHV